MIFIVDSVRSEKGKKERKEYGKISEKLHRMIMGCRK